LSAKGQLVKVYSIPSVWKRECQGYNLQDENNVDVKLQM